jgi:hypothetical protein
MRGAERIYGQVTLPSKTGNIERALMSPIVCPMSRVPFFDFMQLLHEPPLSHEYYVHRYIYQCLLTVFP